MTPDTTFADFRIRLFDFIHRSAQEVATAPEQLSRQNDAFGPLVLALFRLQFEHNLPYRKFCESRNLVPANLSRWNDIPAVPTTAFKDLELTCLLPQQRTNVFHSSGTTEHRPSRHFHNPTSLALYETSSWIWFARNVLTNNLPQKLLILTPSPEHAPHSSLVHMFETIRHKMRAEISAFVGVVKADSAWTLDFDSAISSLRTETPIVLLGTAFSFVQLLDHLASQNLSFHLPPGSRAMETGGYKGRSRTLPKHELHELITHHLGISNEDIICEYGMSELSSQAYNTTFSYHFQFPPWARAQIISPETGKEVPIGETGLIRVFDLANVYSVIAIQTEDLAIRHETGFEFIGRAEMAEPRGCSLMAAKD